VKNKIPLMQSPKSFYVIFTSLFKMLNQLEFISKN
jgi:hypothetical protein